MECEIEVFVSFTLDKMCENCRCCPVFEEKYCEECAYKKENEKENKTKCE